MGYLSYWYDMTQRENKEGMLGKIKHKKNYISKFN